MSDADHAQEFELMDWERNNRARSVQRRFVPGESGYGPAECEECGDDMPPERRAMGSRICTDCKARQEHLQKLKAA